MFKIHFLGTCSGTEPMPDMHHCSIVMEIGAAIYWFDAGENCSHRAYTTGIDIMKTRALFISLLLFVALPVPGTGAWSGSLVASLFGLPKKESFFAILFGVLICGVIMCLASYGVLGFLSFLI